MSCYNIFDYVFNEGEKGYDYHRKPTQGEISFGEGATHWKTFPASKVTKPDGSLKSWVVCDIDGLRYYR